MPELPEVETMRRGLQDTIAGRRIVAVEVRWPPVFDVPEPVIDTEVAGHRITAVRRRGKVLIFDLDSARHLLLHPKMTGQLVVQRRGRTVFPGGHPSRSMLGPMPNPTTRVVLTMDRQVSVFFNDQRKFGWLRLVTTPQLASDQFLSRLGPEPLSPEFTVAALRERLAHHRHAAIKAVLLDQTTVAGIGNIYADECLHQARLHPCRPAGELSTREVNRLHQVIRDVLGGAVEHGGTSFANFVNEARGRDTYLAHMRVFRRQGQPCPVCGTTIERIRVAGRGTNLCPHCQPYDGYGPAAAAEHLRSA